jgi:hypothetical protein
MSDLKVYSLFISLQKSLTDEMLGLKKKTKTKNGFNKLNRNKRKEHF